MAFRKLTVDAFRQKDSRSWPAILSTTYRGAQWMDANYIAYAKEGYCWNPDVYACVNATVRAFRGLKFGVYRTKGSGRDLVTKGPFSDLIAKPNARQAWSDLAGQWAGSLEITGNAYMEGVSLDGDKEIISRPPMELFILRPDRMFVVPGDAKIPIAGYEYRAGSVITPYKVQMWRSPDGYRPRCPVMHSKYWHPLNDFYGLSPLSAASRNVDAFNSAIAWNVSLTQQSSRPSGTFTTDAAMTTTQAEEWTNLIRQKFSGPGNAGRPMVLGGGFTWEQMGMSPLDMDWLKGLEWNTLKICAVYGIPPELIGDSSGRTYSNFQEARKAVYMEKWLPLADMFCADVNLWLAPMFSDAYGEEVFLGYDKDDIEAIQEDDAIKWQKAKEGAGFLQVNEQRAIVGLEPLPEGDVIMVPVGSIPLSVAGAQKIMPQTQSTNNQKPVSAATPKPGKKGIDGLLDQIAEQRERLKLIA